MDSLVNSKDDKPTGGYTSESHKPGVKIFRTKGRLSEENLEKWREEIEAFVEENEERGACGMLIDISQVEALNVDALDVLLELLSDPEEVIRETRTRFALIGVKPFAQRFLREAMPLEPVKHIRARFFHEVAEKEALAWLTAMVDSADDLPETSSKTKEQVDKTKKPTPVSSPPPTPTLPKPQPAKKAPDSPVKKPQLLGKKNPGKDTSS
jgi:anti-anti-sigma regulatory factor